MIRWYDSRQYLKYAFIVVATLIAIVSVVVSDSLIRKLAEEEHRKMEVWTEAQRLFILDDSTQTGQISLIWKVMESNTTIPVICCDDRGDIVSYNNIRVPDRNPEPFLQKKVREFRAKRPPFTLDFGDNTYQYLYYDDSVILKRLLLYPYIQLLVIAVFIMISFLALAATKKSEQNKVWVGLSKETAHQLGTPISSLIAWVEYLKTKEVNAAYAAYLPEMEKDVKRLEVIAERFSKIGSNPDIVPLDINKSVLSACGYMKSRISPKVKISVAFSRNSMPALMNEALFSWVIENLTKNAVDAMDGQGAIGFRINEKGGKILVDVTDTGKGIPKSKFKTVFMPGYTTKARGWGLGLSLVRRIVESYPGGKIYVKNSEPGKGTTFRIELRRHVRSSAGAVTSPG
ncbi:MAG: HAMP domain-containing histidine kinase [Tannerella sp.]|jgi:signal transduction histidine kinase|nr:HAMP domain-containing histidine kinase [Tannerella sp.]